MAGEQVTNQSRSHRDQEESQKRKEQRSVQLTPVRDPEEGGGESAVEKMALGHRLFLLFFLQSPSLFYMPLPRSPDVDGGGCMMEGWRVSVYVYFGGLGVNERTRGGGGEMKVFA